MKPLVVANWKMNPQNLAQARWLFNSVKKEGMKGVEKAKVVICPPFVFLSNIQPKSNIKIGAQNCFWEESGAFTGETSPTMLKNLGCEYVIIGHSERRRLFGETDKMVNKKIKTALRAGLKPILCIDKISQLKNVEKELQTKNYKLKTIIIAFEPLSAIGTGKPYSVEKAKKMRQKIKHSFVLYGGSVNSQNVSDYIKKAGFQGLLIGGASLKPKEFIKILKTINKP